MTFARPQLVALVIGAALNLYVVLGGADFGGGVWDLLATGPRRDRQRELIAHAIGPIWEANHVWLVFALVLFFSAFPAAFSTYMIALHVPITVALVGIVLRGSSFAFRAYGVRDGSAEAHRWGRVFAIASTVTPFVLGTCVGALAAGRVHLSGNVPVNGFIGTWFSPFPFAVGLLTVALFGVLAAVYLTVESDDPDLRADFRHRALAAAVATGAIAAGAALLARSEAPNVWRILVSANLTLPFHLATGVCALGVILALVVRRFSLARVAVVLQTSFILWGWFASQYPYFVAPELSIYSAAAPEHALGLTLIVTGVGAVVVFPAFFLLYRTFRKISVDAPR